MWSVLYLRHHKNCRGLAVPYLNEALEGITKERSIKCVFGVHLAKKTIQPFEQVEQRENIKASETGWWNITFENSVKIEEIEKY